MAVEKLLLITTGGTIDGADSDTGQLKQKSELYSYLLENSKFEINYQAPINKDSREITQVDRENILSIIENSSIEKIIIGHGTYTICETGCFLKSRLQGTDRLILLLGAWIPFNEPGSDAVEQVRNAINFLKENKGIYIAMDGQLWDPDITSKVQKSDGTWHLIVKS